MQIQGICRKFLAEKRIGKALKAGIPGGEKPVFQKEKGEKAQEEKGNQQQNFSGEPWEKFFKEMPLYTQIFFTVYERSEWRYAFSVEKTIPLC